MKDSKEETYKYNKNTACFAQIKSDIFDYSSTTKKTTNYVVFVNRETNLVDSGYSHYCPFTIKEIRSHLKEFKRIQNYHFRVISGQFKDDRNISFDTKIYITFTGRHSQHLALLSWIRYLYEYPYCFALLEARRMQRLKPYLFTSTINLLNTVIIPVQSGESGHSLSIGRKYTTLNKIHKKFSSSYFDSVNNIIPTKIAPGFGWTAPDDCRFTFDVNKLRNTNNWTYESFLSDRLPIYEQIYKRLYK